VIVAGVSGGFEGRFRSDWLATAEVLGQRSAGHAAEFHAGVLAAAPAA